MASKSLGLKLVQVAFGYGLTTVASIWTTKLYANVYAFDDFSAAIIFKICSSVILAIFALGMPIALQRTVAFEMSNPRRAATVAITGITIGTLSVGAACLLLARYSSFALGYLNLHGKEELWKATMFVTVCQTFATMVGLVQIARDKVQESNFILFSTNGLSPLLGLILCPSGSISTVIFIGGGLASLFAVPSFISILRWVGENGLWRINNSINLLLAYGLPRTIASVIEPLVELSIPTVAILIGVGLSGAGYLAIGLSLLRPLNPLLGIISIVLIPATASLVASNNFEGNKNRAIKILSISSQLGVFASIQMVVWCDVLTKLWLGEKYVNDSISIRLMLLSIAPSAIYGALRGIVDGETEKPINTINLVISFFVLFISLAVLTQVATQELPIVLAYFFSKMYLGCSTAAVVIKRNAIKLREARLFLSLSLSMLLGVCAWFIKSSANIYNPVVVLISIVSMALALYITLLYYKTLCGFIAARGRLWKV